MEDKLRKLLLTKTRTDTSAQYDLISYIKLCSKRIDLNSISSILDLGCGTGSAYEHLRTVFPQISYRGVDIGESPEVDRRERVDLKFDQYDGLTLPYEDGSFDAIYCKQVLEHVRYPDVVIKEASRVLKDGGYFFGSVSQLEPYHSHSVFNWTAFGIISVFEDYNLVVSDIHPGIDGITLTLRRIFVLDKFNAFFSNESVFNHYIEKQYLSTSVQARLYEKIVCAGHLIFIARKN